MRDGIKGVRDGKIYKEFSFLSIAKKKESSLTRI
jgi:hypothetical protein